jgi:hypothetical protein
MLKDSEIGNIAAIGPAGHPPCSKYERLIADAKQVRAPTTVVVHPCEETALRGPIEAAEAGIIVPILIGPAAKIAAVAREHRLDISRFEIVDVPHSHAAAAKAVELIRSFFELRASPTRGGASIVTAASTQRKRGISPSTGPIQFACALWPTITPQRDERPTGAGIASMCEPMLSIEAEAAGIEPTDTRSGAAE